MKGVKRFSGGAVPHPGRVVVRATGDQIPGLRLVHHAVHVVGVSLQGLHGHLHNILVNHKDIDH